MKNLVLSGVICLLLMSCSGTNFSSSGDSETSNAIVSSNSTDSTSSTVTSSTTLTSEMCDGTETDFATVQTALLNQLQLFIDQVSSGTVSQTTYSNRNTEICKQIVTAQQIVASATDFSQDFTTILQHACDKIYGSGDDRQEQEQDQQQHGHRPPPRKFGDTGRPPHPPQFPGGQPPQHDFNNSNFQSY